MAPRPARRARRVALNAAAAAFCVLWIFPVYWMLNTSFKPFRDILTATPKFVPFPMSIGNFTDAVRQPFFLDYLRNSLIVTCGVVAASVAVAFLAATALARFRFFGRTAFGVVVLLSQMVPPAALLVPLFLTAKDLDMLNSLIGLGITYLAFVLPLTIWVLRGFIMGVPVELEEAAKVDGAGPVTVICRILFPLAVPGVIATSVFAFITAWNDFLYAYVMMKDQTKYTLPVWLVSFSTNTGTDFGGLIAASTIVAVPVTAFFLLIQHRLVAGLSAGAIKG
jgi:N,N'-diacetylchitobiose transport system permease protein